MSLPPNIRINASVPFPPIVQGAGGVTVSKANGIWTISAAGAIGASGQATINFGAFPGSSDTSITVSDTGVQGSSMVLAEILAVASADHSGDEHWAEEIDIRPGNIVVGVGFTIYARTRNAPLYGAWNVSWFRR